MTDKPNGTATGNGTATAIAGAGNPSPFAAPKSQLYNPIRHPYRPNPSQHHQRRRRSRRSCVCFCCIWSTIVLLSLILLAAIAGCIFYVLYSPRRPVFSVTALRISQFNLSSNPADDTTRLSSAFNLTVSAKNPNKKLIYIYDPIVVTALSAQIEIANGSFPSFVSAQKNITILRSRLSASSVVVDPDSEKALRSDLKRKNGLSLKLEMDTNVVVKIEKLHSKKLGIRVTCDDIHGFPPKGKSASIASISDSKCKVDLRIKIWKWTF
ncbi:hypothetical protein NMG60_11000763 [Bertholletia excelsa]